MWAESPTNEKQVWVILTLQSWIWFCLFTYLAVISAALPFVHKAGIKKKVSVVYFLLNRFFWIHASVTINWQLQKICFKSLSYLIFWRKGSCSAPGGLHFLVLSWPGFVTWTVYLEEYLCIPNIFVPVYTPGCVFLCFACRDWLTAQQAAGRCWEQRA